MKKDEIIGTLLLTGICTSSVILGLGIRDIVDDTVCPALSKKLEKIGILTKKQKPETTTEDK